MSVKKGGGRLFAPAFLRNFITKEVEFLIHFFRKARFALQKKAQKNKAPYEEGAKARFSNARRAVLFILSLISDNGGGGEGGGIFVYYTPLCKEQAAQDPQ